jgi:hypothetical protein
VVYAKSDKVLLTDLDHEFTEETLRAMADAPPCGKNAHKIYRRDVETGAFRKGHSNTFFLFRARFLRFGGYDEEFCGHYGSDDTRFVKYQMDEGPREPARRRDDPADRPALEAHLGSPLARGGAVELSPAFRVYLHYRRFHEENSAKIRGNRSGVWIPVFSVP